MKSEVEQKKKNIIVEHKSKVLDKYGGEEHFAAPDKELLFGQTGAYKEYTRAGGVQKIVLQWFYSGSTVVQKVVLQWFYSGSTVVQSSGSTVVLQWFYSGSTKLMSFLSFQFLNLAVLTRTHCRAH